MVRTENEMLLNFLIGHTFARSRSVDELFGSRDYVKHSICITTCSRRAHEPITLLYIYIYIILNYRIGYHQVWESVFLLGWFDSLNCEKVRYPHCCNILCQHMRCGHFWGQIWKPGHTTIYHHLSCFLLGEQCPFWRHDGYPGSGTCAHLNKCWQLLDFLLAQSQEAMLLPTSIWSWSGSSWMVIIVPTIINHLWLPIPEVGQ